MGEIVCQTINLHQAVTWSTVRENRGILPLDTGYFLFAKLREVAQSRNCELFNAY